jgi:hypothetical protein
MDMTLYVQFLGCLAVGLVGTGIVLTVLLEKLFHDWDVVADMGEWFSGLKQKQGLTRDRAEDMLMELERSRQVQAGGGRMIDQRRQQLAELASVEKRLQSPSGGAILLTPLPPPRAAGEVETRPA